MFQQNIYADMDAAEVRDVVYRKFQAAGWRLERQGNFAAIARRGSKAMVALFGVFAGSRQTFVQCKIEVFTNPSGGSVARVTRISGDDFAGKAGVRKAELILQQLCDQLEDEFGTSL